MHRSSNVARRKLTLFFLYVTLKSWKGLGTRLCRLVSVVYSDSAVYQLVLYSDVDRCIMYCPLVCTCVMLSYD